MKKTFEIFQIDEMLRNTNDINIRTNSVIVRVNDLNILIDGLSANDERLINRGFINQRLSTMNDLEIDYVIATHHHRDHIDANELQIFKMQSKAKVVMYDKTAQHFNKKLVDITSDTFETFMLRNFVTVTFIPALHSCDNVAIIICDETTKRKMFYANDLSDLHISSYEFLDYQNAKFECMCIEKNHDSALSNENEERHKYKDVIKFAESTSSHCSNRVSDYIYYKYKEDVCERYDLNVNERLIQKTRFSMKANTKHYDENHFEEVKARIVDVIEETESCKLLVYMNDEKHEVFAQKIMFDTKRNPTWICRDYLSILSFEDLKKENVYGKELTVYQYKNFVSLSKRQCNIASYDENNIINVSSRLLYFDYYKEEQLLHFCIVDSKYSLKHFINIKLRNDEMKRKIFSILEQKLVCNNKYFDSKMLYEQESIAKRYFFNNASAKIVKLENRNSLDCYSLTLNTEIISKKDFLTGKVEIVYLKSLEYESEVDIYDCYNDLL